MQIKSAKVCTFYSVVGIGSKSWTDRIGINYWHRSWVRWLTKVILSRTFNSAHLQIIWSTRSEYCNITFESESKFTFFNELVGFVSLELLVLDLHLHASILDDVWWGVEFLLTETSCWSAIWIARMSLLPMKLRIDWPVGVIYLHK